MLARFDNVRLAQAFSDYLRTQGLPHRLVDAGDHLELWVDEEAMVDAVRRELAQFREDPTHPRYLGASWEAPPPEREVEALSRRYGLRESLSPRYWLAGRGPLTVLLALVILAVAGWTQVGENRVAVDLLLFPDYGDDPRGITEPWRVLTPILLHFGALHLIFNLLWWWTLGSLIERAQGTLQLALLTVGVALVSNAAQYHVDGPAFGGLSGVVYGLMGYLWVYGLLNPYAGFRLRPAIVNFMLLWMVLGFTGLIGPVANTAHLVGLLAGCAIGAVFALWRRLAGRAN
jgi:GlpG protein